MASRGKGFDDSLPVVNPKTTSLAPPPADSESPGEALAGPGPAPPPDDGMLAAVDLGSNSFRMVIARRQGGELRPVDRLREGVRLAECLDAHRNITQEGVRRALECLRKFGQRVRDFPQGSVRAVGTNTLRKARNTASFLRQAERALGHPIDVVSGQEEARLIFVGASHSLANSEIQRLVVDIGGGSTECVVGRDYEPRLAESLYMGCVGLTLAHFPGGRLTAKRMRKAKTAAKLELRPMKSAFRKLGWKHAVGTSGTIHAVAGLLRLQGWITPQGITRDGLARLEQALLAVDHVDDLVLKGLRRDRAKVLPGGFAILSAVFDSLEIESMTAADGALREGALYDLLGRIQNEDARDRTIQRFLRQYQVDTSQSQRIETTALALVDQVSESWKLDPVAARLFVSWAARLHEIGLSVAHGGYHKHGAYIIEQSDMPGFSFQDQALVALLVRSMRRKIPIHLFSHLSKKRGRFALRLCLLLRLAAVLNRSRSRRPMPTLELAARKKKIRLRFPGTWLDEHPLTRADLVQEATYLSTIGIRLEVRPRPDSQDPERRPS